MFIEFSEDFSKSLSSFDPVEVEEIFQRARLASKDGYHIISCQNKKTAYTIIEFIHEKSKILESFFHEVLDYISEINTLKKQFSLYISIISNSQTNLNVKPEDEVKIGMDIAKSASFWKQLQLLVEYSRDAVFYDWITKYVKEKNKNLKKIKTSFNVMNGGGGTTHREMLRLNTEKQMVLCFLDSDKKFPEQEEYGATAKDFSETDRSGISDFYVMKAHELENLFFSRNIVLDLHKKGEGKPKEKEQRKKTFDEIEKKISFVESNVKNFRLYFDVKKGYKKKDIVGIRYLQNALGVNAYCANKRKTCNKECDVCCEPVIAGYGTEYLLLIKCKYSGNIRDLFRDAETLNELQKQEWELIGKKLISWSCSYKYNSHGI